jgi:hypothetical protein
MGAGKQSENSRDSKDHNRADRGEKSSERNATNDQNRSNRNAKNERDSKDRNAENNRDRNDARAHERGASTGTSEGAEGHSGNRGSLTSVTTEQKTKIRSVFTSHRVEPARNINVAVNVGVRLPHSVHLYPVPQEVIEIVPAYREYEYILLEDNRVAIVDPDTFEVVDIIVLT